MLQYIHPVDIAICAGYALLVIVIGIWAARGQHSNEDYFLGGRKMHWLPVGLSIFAGTFSANSFVGLPSTATYHGWHLLLSIFCIPLIVTPIVWFVFVPLYHRLQVTSAYEYLEIRFHRGIRLTASLLYASYVIGWMGTMLFAVGKVLRVVLELEDNSDVETGIALVVVGLFATAYTTIGGVRAVVWTDALQAFALGGGMVLVLIVGMAALDGGWGTFWTVAVENHKFEMFNTNVDFGYTVEKGAVALGENNLFQSDNVFAALAFGVFIYLGGHAASFTHVQRYVSMPSVAAARRSLLINGTMTAVVCTLFFVVGTMLFVFYQQTDNPLMAELGKKDHGDRLLPFFVIHELRLEGLTGLMLAGLFAAVMSSIDSGINSLSAMVVVDWLPQRKLPLIASRIICAGFGLAAIAMSLVLMLIGGDIFPLLMKISGMFLGILLGIFLLGIFVPQAGTPAAIAAYLAGALGIAAAFILGVSHWWLGAFACVPTFVVGCVVGLMFPKWVDEEGEIGKAEER